MRKDVVQNVYSLLTSSIIEPPSSSDEVVYVENQEKSLSFSTIQDLG